MRLKSNEGRAFSTTGVTLIMAIILAASLLGMFYFF